MAGARGRGAGRGRAAPLPATVRADGTDDLIRLPRGTRALRLEAAEAGPRFRLDAVRIEAAGRIEAALLSAEKIIERLPPQSVGAARLLRRAVGLLRSVPPGEIWRRLTRAAQTHRPPASYAAWIQAVEAKALPSIETMRRSSGPCRSAH